MYEQQIIIAPSRQGRSCEAAQIAKSMPTWLLLLLGVASRQEQPYHKGNDRPAPWRCDEPRSRARTDLCFPLDDSLRDDGSEDVRLYNMEPEPVKTNRSCCGLPPVKCPANTEYPLTCLLDKVPFATPPACVKRQFKCCLDYWTNRFRLDEAYEMAPPHVRCDSKFWDVYDVQADDVIFDQRSLMKLAAAFYPKILVPYEAERVPALTELNGTNRDYVVVAKLGFGWFDPDAAKPDALVLAHNLLRNPARPRRHAYALPRGVKDLKLWKDRCADNRRPDRVRCAGIRLHRDRARKILALRKNGVCERTARTGRHSGILKGAGYVDALSAARYAVSPPGVGFANYRDTEAIVAGAVPILERPRWPPQRGPVVDLHDELPHVLVKNDTAWASLRNDLDHLPSQRPAGDARKHYLPYWLYFILKRLRAANVTEATCMEPRAEKVEAKVHTSCRWAAIGAPWDNLAVNMGPFQNVGRRRIAKPRAWGGEGAWRRKVGRPSGAAY